MKTIDELKIAAKGMLETTKQILKDGQVVEPVILMERNNGSAEIGALDIKSVEEKVKMFASLKERFVQEKAVSYIFVCETRARSLEDPNQEPNEGVMVEAGNSKGEFFTWLFKIGKSSDGSRFLGEQEDYKNINRNPLTNTQDLLDCIKTLSN